MNKSDERSGGERGAILTIAGGLVVFLLLALKFRNFTLDDSFIAFRYARHLGTGHGIAWNVGEWPRVEGYTSFLWMAILSIPAALGLDLALASKILGVVSTLVTFAVCYRFVILLSRSTGTPINRAAAAVGVLLLAFSSYTALHAVSGMETALAACLMTVFLYLLTAYLMNPARGKALRIALAALLLGLTRPEANLTVVAGIGVLFFLSKARRQLLAWVFAAYVLPGLVYFLWRWSYFGLPLPLPFYVKALGHGLLPGLPTVRAFVVETSALILLTLIAWHRNYRNLLPGVVASAVFLGYFVFPEHIMGDNYRFLFPVYPALVVFAAFGLGRLWEMVDLSGRGGRSLVVILCLFVGFLQLERWPWSAGFAGGYSSGMASAHIRLGNALKAIDPTGKSSLAIGDAGAVPFYSGWHTIDTFGLNDRTVSLSRKHDPAQVLSQAPDVIVLISRSAETFVPRLSWEQALYEGCLQRGYAKMSVLTFAPDSYYLWVMAIPGSHAADELGCLQQTVK